MEKKDEKEINEIKARIKINYTEKTNCSFICTFIKRINSDLYCDLFGKLLKNAKESGKILISPERCNLCKSFYKTYK